jgi:molybdopterin-guanine dinucleotide biosynthesis protein A
VKEGYGKGGGESILGSLGVVILAGGRGTRIGRDKCLLELCGKPLLLYVIEKALMLEPDRVVVVLGRGNLERYGSMVPSRVSLSEDIVEGVGPLAGIVSGMRRIDTDYALILPCDTPFIKLDVLRFLYDKAGEADAVIPRWPNGYIEPLQAFYRTSAALKAAEEALLEAGRSCREMIRRLNRILYVNVDELRRIDPELITFFNINSMDDLLRAEKFLKGSITTLK